MLKKAASLIIAFMLCMLVGVPAFAVESEATVDDIQNTDMSWSALPTGNDLGLDEDESSLGEPTEGQSNDLYVLTYDCPTEIIEYTKENISRAIRSAMKDDGNIFTESEIKVGQPFTYGEYINHMFTFPVYTDDKIIYTFRAGYSPDGRICGTLSKFLVDELNEYIGATTDSEPLRLHIAEKTLYGTVNNDVKALATFGFYEEDSNEDQQQSRANAKLVVENLSDYLKFTPSLNTTRDPARYINLSITEVQPKESIWCVAYATAAILRTQLKISSTAKGIMNYYELDESDTLSMKMALAYAQMSGLESASYVSYGLTDSQLMAEIDSFSPVLEGMEASNYPGFSHAVVLRGYSVADIEWSIWDPMYRSYQYYSMRDLYLTPDGYYFDYLRDRRTIYNYHK